LATNLEKVEEEHGTDFIIRSIMQMCRKMKVPLVYSMTRYRLGCATKFKGQKVSACGVMNYQSANEEFNALIQAVDEAREVFYRELA
jgi:ribosomal protein L7Ae-like RNA K-turn-binding protein